MAGVEVFDTHTDRYEQWFDEHPDVYRAELRAVRELLEDCGNSLEVGVGSGRFAAPLGVEHGIDPSQEMLSRARERGVKTVKGVAEDLPFPRESFDCVLMVTTVCFVDDLQKALSEARRVLRDGGRLVVGLVGRDTPLGRHYRKSDEGGVFYRSANFLSAEQLIRAMQAAGFGEFDYRQTLFSGLDEIGEDEPVRNGRGEGSFIVISGRKQSRRR